MDGEIKRVDEPALTAINMRLRDDYTADCQRGLDRWNKIIERTGVDFKLKLPHVAFHREIGEFRDIEASPDGRLLDDASWQREKDKWLPSTADGDFIGSLMKPCASRANSRPGSRRLASASTTSRAISNT